MRKLIALAALIVATSATVPAQATTRSLPGDRSLGKETALNNAPNCKVRSLSKTWHGYPVTRIC